MAAQEVEVFVERVNKLVPYICTSCGNRTMSTPGNKKTDCSNCGQEAYEATGCFGDIAAQDVNAHGEILGWE